MAERQCAAEGPQRGTEAVIRLLQEGLVKWRTPKNRTEIKKRSKIIEVHLTVRVDLEYRKLHEKIQGKVRYLFWDRTQIEEGGMKEQFNRETKQSWRFAADAARITDGRAKNEDRKHPSGGVFVAVDQAVNEERITQARVNVRGSLRVFSVYFWHSEGWTARSAALLEAVVKQARVTKHVVGEYVSRRCCEKSFVPKGAGCTLWPRKKRRHAGQRPKG